MSEEMIKMIDCPFCGGKARISRKEIKYKGQNSYGIKLIRVSAYGLCNKCHATGPHIYADVHFYSSNFKEEIQEIESKAAEAWNRRKI
jgi:hypothetical protein